MKTKKPNPIRALCNSLPGGVAELARETGVTRQTVYGWIAGRKVPGPSSKRKLVEKYSLDISELTNIECEETQDWGSTMDLAREMVQMIRETNEVMAETLVGRVAAIETQANARLAAMEDRIKVIGEALVDVNKNSNQVDSDCAKRLSHLEDRLTYLTKKLLGDVD